MLNSITFTGLRRHAQQGSVVIIEDDHGNPLVAAVEAANGVTTIHTIAQPNFQDVLRALGVDRVVTVERVGQKSKPGGELWISPTQRSN